MHLRILRGGAYLGYSEWALKAITSILTIERQRETDTQKTRDRMMQPQAKECWHPPKAGGGREQILSWSLRESTALLMPSFQAAALQDCCFKLYICSNLFQQLRKRTQCPSIFSHQHSLFIPVAHCLLALKESIPLSICCTRLIVREGLCLTLVLSIVIGI